MSNLSSPNSGSNNHTDSELEHQSSTSLMNVEFIEQQPLVAEDARLGHSLKSLPPIMEKQMPDEHWMAAKQLSKPVVIRQFRWLTDSAVGANLNTFAFPAVITEQDTIHQETLRMYSFYKFNWKLRFQINGTKFHSGQLIVSWDPFTQADQYVDYRPFNVVYATGLPSVLLNASSNEPVEILIPFVHPRNFLTTNSSAGYDELGTVRVTVLNPLRAAEGSSTALSITVWLYADSPSVHVPIYRHDLLVPNRELALPTMDLVKGLLGEGVGNLVGDVGSTFGNLVTGNFGGAMRSGGKALTGLAGVLGLDYPARIVIEQSHINPLGPMSPGKGVDQSYWLGTDPRGGCPPVSEQTGATVEECDMNLIKKVPMLFRQVLWPDTYTAGSILTSFPVTPNIVSTYVDSKKRTVSANTYLSWYSNAFAFWKGALRYRFEWVSTQFHTGRVLIAFIPNQFDGSPTLQQAFSCPNIVVDLQQSSLCNVTVPFVSPTIWKRTDIVNDFVADEELVGYVYVFVLNSLVRPSNVSDTIEFNIYVSAEDDFTFAVPKANVLSVVPNADVPEVAIRTIGNDRMEARSAGQDAQSEITLSFGDALIPPVNFFCEEFPLTDYIKRYGLIRSTNSASAELRNLPNSFLVDVPGDPLPSGVQVMTPLKTVQSTFACWYGSLRYKIATNANRSTNSFLMVSYSPTRTIGQNSSFLSGSGQPLQRTNLSQNSSLDVAAPCYTPYNLLLAQSPQNTLDAHHAGCIRYDIVGLADTETTRVDIYQAAGDEYRPFYLISPPADYSSSHYRTALR